MTCCGRKHITYASNGIDVIRIELINTRTTILALIADGAQAEPLRNLIEHIHARSSALAG